IPPPATRGAPARSARSGRHIPDPGGRHPALGAGLDHHRQRRSSYSFDSALAPPPWRATLVARLTPRPFPPQRRILHPFSASAAAGCGADASNRPGHVSVAAGEDGDGVAAAGLPSSAGERGNGRGARVLDEEFPGPEDPVCRVPDLVVGQGDDLVDEFAYVCEGEVTGSSGQESIREALAYLDGRGPSLLDGGAHRVRALGLDADDAAGGPYLFDPRGGAADEPASADRNDNVFDLAPVLEDLLSDGPLPRDDVGVVEGRDHGESAFGCDRFRPLLSLDGGRACEDDLGAECGCAFSLDGRGRGRHNDGGGDAELPRGECDGLGVVPGGVRDDAPPPVVVGESGDEVVRAADLECPGALEI